MTCARALLTLVEIDYWRSGESAATTLAEEALADAQDPVLKARCHAAVALYAGTVDVPKAAASARAALALLEDVPDPDRGLVAAALSARIRADLFLGDGFDHETATRALELEESGPPATVDTRVVFKLGQWLRYVDDFDGARASLEQAEQQASEEGDESSLANILLNRVIVATWAGDLPEAAELAERMVDAFGQQGVGAEAGDIWRAYVAAYAGRIEAVHEAAAKAVPGEPIGTALWNRCLGLAELAAGETSSADRHLTDALEVFEHVAFREPAIWRVDGDAIEAAWRSVLSTEQKGCSPASRSARPVRASRGILRSRHGAAAWCSRRAAISTPPRRLSSAPSPSTSAVRCHSNAPGRCSSRVGCSGG